jgi:hypothetical protein
VRSTEAGIPRGCKGLDPPDKPEDDNVNEGDDINEGDNISDE